MASGGSTTLTVTATNATQVVITDNSDTKTYTLPGTGGTQVVSPTSLTTYMATASDASGFTNVATVTVSIIPTVTITASTTTALPGQPVTLTFTSANASSASINGTDVPPTGCTTSNPCSLKEYVTQTTTYTITASGTGGKATASATVTLVPPITFNGLTADTANLGQGNQQTNSQLAQQDADPNGAVGTKQFMEYINIQYQAYDKVTHAPVWSSPQMIGTPWLNTLNQGDITNCDGHTLSNGTLSGIHLDAVIDFDRIASRWVVMGRGDFLNSSNQNTYYLCLAVSNTDDLTSPTLGWYGYSFYLNPSVTSQSGQVYFPDWPKLGIWSDGYYVTMDMEDVSNAFAEVGVAACVFDRTEMLQGAASPSWACDIPSISTDPTSGLYLGHSLIPADIDGTTAPPSGRPEYMVSIENPSVVQGQTASSVINLWEATTDWTSSPPTLTLTSTQPTVNTYTPGCYLYDGPLNYAFTSCIPEPQNDSQPEITDSVGDRLMPRFAYRNFGAYESYLVSQTVQTGPGSTSNGANAFQTGIRWYELRDNGTGTPSINQQGTVNPDDVQFRFLPSIAQDHSGNAAVGYSVSNGDTNPGINFSFWNLNTANATPIEVTLLNGTGEELTTFGDPGGGYPGEWGTYSSMTVDPVDDCTFWYVNEYYATDSLNSWSTSISSFQIPGCQ
ncbi:MAG: hypothetical protein WA252_08555 [Candidatus Sulfotelmatobacter sp.]